MLASVGATGHRQPRPHAQTSRSVSPARAAKSLAVAEIVCSMTRVAIAGVPIAGTIATPRPRSTNRSTASISAPSSTTFGLRDNARNAASVALR